MKLRDQYLTGDGQGRRVFPAIQEYRIVVNPPPPVGNGCGEHPNVGDVDAYVALDTVVLLKRTKKWLFFYLFTNWDQPRALLRCPIAQARAILSPTSITIMYNDVTTFDIVLRIDGEIWAGFSVLALRAIVKLGEPAGNFADTTSILYIVAMLACISCLVAFKSLGWTVAWMVRAVKALCGSSFRGDLDVTGFSDDSSIPPHHVSTLPNGRVLDADCIKDGVAQRHVIIPVSDASSIDSFVTSLGDSAPSSKRVRHAHMLRYGRRGGPVSPHVVFRATGQTVTAS